MIQVTEKAQKEIQKILAKQDKPGMGLRMGVKGGGCAGMEYQLDLDVEKPGDRTFEFGGSKVFVDTKSYLYLVGMTLDYSEGLLERGFKFLNPNAKRSCGCGTSFST